MRNDKENLIVSLTLQFALDIINYCDKLEESRKFVVSNQLLKSGTSIGANVNEAHNAESKADFIHKLKIAAKECEETEYWLLLCQHAENYPDARSLLDKNLRIKKLLSSIISTSKSKLK